MSKRIGALLLFLVVAVVVIYQVTSRRAGGGSAGGSSGSGSAPAPGSAGPAPAGTPLTVKGLIGGEKMGLLKDERVQRILNERYGVTVDYTRAGSIDMVRGKTAGQDFLWPSSQIALELYRQRGGTYRKAEVLFNSPLVLYSRAMVTDALVRDKLVRKSGTVLYVEDFGRMLRIVNEGRSWKDLGLPQLYGKAAIRCTDPARSNSGNMFAGLLANMLNGGEVVDSGSLGKVLPGVKRFFARQGYMVQSSSDLFNEFLQQGVGSYPLIVGYEAQIIEFSIENPQYGSVIQKEITTLYPRPTAWSSHPLISLTPSGDRLLAGMQDPQIQRLAWEAHGFRSGMSGVQNDPKAIHVPGIAPAIENVMPMPRPQVMERIITALSGS